MISLRNNKEIVIRVERLVENEVREILEDLDYVRHFFRIWWETIEILEQERDNMNYFQIQIIFKLFSNINCTLHIICAS